MLTGRRKFSGREPEACAGYQEREHEKEQDLFFCGCENISEPAAE